MATFNDITSELTFNCQEIGYIGFHKVRIDFQFQDYLRNETLSTEFNLLVLPKPILDQYTISIRPQFDWGERAMSYDLLYGEDFHF